MDLGNSLPAWRIMMGQAEFFEKSHHKQEVKVFDLNKKAQKSGS